MAQPFPAYTGDEPYIFICYAHTDADSVYHELAWLKEHGCNIWYDEGIVPGEEWTEELAQAIKGASHFLYFVTPNSIQSRKCRDEIHFALNLDIHLVSVHLSETELTDGLTLSIGLTQAILKHELALQDYQAKLLASVSVPAPRISSVSTPNKRRGSRLFAVVSVAALVSVSIGLFLYGRTLDTPQANLAEMETAADPSPLLGLDQRLGIAVLPFVNMSSDPDNEYFSDGISEEILDMMVKTNTLPVIARTSSFQFKGQSVDAQTIGKQLNVSHLLQGSVRKDGDRVRVAAQLIDTMTGLHLWSNRYDRHITDIFSIQDDKARQIVDQIGLALTDGGEPLGAQQTSGSANTEAYELYLRAKYLANADDPTVVESAIPLFREAIALDNDFADAWVELGHTYDRLTHHPFMLLIPSEYNPLAIEAYKNALRVNPRHADAMGSLGGLLITHEYEWNRGLSLIAKAVGKSPQDAALQARYGFFLFTINHPDADDVMSKAYLLNPFDTYVILVRAAQFAYAGRLVDAVTLMDTALIQNRDRFETNILSALFNSDAGRFDRAERHLARARKVVGSEYPFIKIIEYRIAAGTGDESRSRALRTQLYEIAKTTRVGHFLDVFQNEKEIVEIYDLALTQRHAEILPLLFKAKPDRMPESEWPRVQKLTRIAEVDLNKKW